jgi:RNA polymerase sigma-70 factor, ECF subfamily
MTVKDISKEILAKEVLANLSALHRFGFSICQSKQQSEELVSETIVKAFENRQQLREEEKIKQWLFRILNNVFISNYRKTKKEKRVSLPNDANDSFSLYEQVSFSSFTDEGSPEKGFINKITREKIHDAVNGLPQEFRTALVLCDVNEFSYAEIAAITQVAIGTIRSRIARARKLLQKQLWVYANEIGITSKQKEKEHVCTCGKEENITVNTRV